MVTCLECGRGAHARGYCFKHYRKVMRDGEAQTCSVPGCLLVREHKETGRCVKHYREHLAEKLSAMAPCHCGKPAVSTRSGKCYEHHEKRARKDLQL